jgi:hypothetical protein
MTSKRSSNSSMEISLYSLASILASVHPKPQHQKLPCAVYLAQRTCEYRMYDFDLSMGHVVSSDLSVDLYHLSRFEALEAQPVTVRQATERQGRFVHALKALLNEDEEFLQAVATCDFYRQEQLGDPEEKLNWFRELPADVRRRASDAVANDNLALAC